MAKTLNQVIQISLQYEGRISQHISMTHIGSIMMRALLLKILNTNFLFNFIKK